jgi:hypothetical protein
LVEDAGLSDRGRIAGIVGDCGGVKKRPADPGK